MNSELKIYLEWNEFLEQFFLEMDKAPEDAPDVGGYREKMKHDLDAFQSGLGQILGSGDKLGE